MHQDDLKEKDEFALFFKIVLSKPASAARYWINSSPQTQATTFAFSSVFILLLYYTWYWRCLPCQTWRAGPQMCGSCWRWRAEHSRTWSGCTAPYRHILNQADPTPLTSSTLIHWSEPMFSILRNLKVMLTRCLKPKNYCMFDQKCMWICGGLLNLCMFAYLPRNEGDCEHGLCTCRRLFWWISAGIKPFFFLFWKFAS